MFFETDTERKDHIKIWRKSNKIQIPIAYSTRKYALKDFENLDGFIRVHNSYIIRKNYIDTVFRPDMFIRLRDGQKVSIGGTYVEQVRVFCEENK